VGTAALGCPGERQLASRVDDNKGDEYRWLLHAFCRFVGSQLIAELCCAGHPGAAVPTRFVREIIHIGVISDTHGLLRPEATAALRGSHYIIHAGDIGDPQILDKLAAIAPVTAVRGNVDHGAWAQKISATNILEIGDVSIYVLHNLQELDLKPEAAKFAAVVYGHSHVPKQELKNGVLYFNPGSAGPRRFRVPVSVGRLTIEGGLIDAKILSLETIT
jgi:uncharacterized protein